MSRVSYSRLARRLNVFTARLGRNSQGVAAVEFGLIAPVLLLMLVGTIEVSRAISIDRKFGAVTSAIADLITRERQVTSADITAMYSIVGHMMRPWDSSTLKIAIVPVKSNIINQNTRCVYAQTTNRPALNGASQTAYGSSYALTNDLMEKGTAVVVIESSYTFTPLFVFSFMGSSTWTDKAILTPRDGHVQFDTPDRFSTNPPC